MNSIRLMGPDVYLTKIPGYSYEVKSGTVVIFAVPIKNGETGRRTFLCEIKEGNRFPAMYLNNTMLGEWTFLVSSLGEAELVEEYSCEEDLIMNFASNIKLHLFSPEDFAEEVVERVNMLLISEEGYIYAVSQEQERTYKNSLNSIYNFFHKGKYKKTMATTQSALYDTVEYLCQHENIDIVSYDILKENYGRRFTIEDIARLSHFTIRNVVLEEDWYHNDSGPLIVFSEEGNKPYACLPKGTNHYILHDCVTGETTKVTSAMLGKISPKAIMVYRPFDNRSLNVKDLVRFAIGSIKKADWVNMFLFALIGVIIGLLLPYFNEKIFDNYIPLDDMSSLVQVSMLILVLSISNLTFTIIKNLAIFRISNTSQVGIQSAIFDRLYNLPTSFFNKYESADVANRALGIAAIIKLLAETMIVSGLSAVFSLLYLFRMNKYSSSLMKTGLVLILINMIVTGVLGFVQIRYEKTLTEKNSKLSSIIYQLLSGISKIRITGVENRAILQYLEPYVEMKKVYIRKERLDNLAININQLMSVLFSAIFYYKMISGDLDISFGAFMGFLSAFGAFSTAMISVVSSFLNFNEAIPIYKRAVDILETPPETSDEAMVPGKITGKIEINNLSFRYGKEEEMVLNDLSLQINPGEYVGIVGPSGCGKSTLLKVLLGFEEPTYGKVYYDNKDIEGLDKRELRKQFGVVLQDGQLISGSIYENIAITGRDITVERVQEAVRDVGLESDIAEMPMGLHTVISEGAGTISGGQRQRILIARAIVNKPSLLFFDEATSALDNVNQDLVCKSLEKLHATRIVIAHRLSTIINCDRIIVLDGGRVVEQGTYSELMALESHFYKLAKRQIVE